MKKTKKKRIKWLLTHIYPNGYTKGGIIYNNPIKCDVIALKYTYTESKTGKKMIAFREMSVDEALSFAEVLIRAVSRYTENNPKIYLKKSANSKKYKQKLKPEKCKKKTKK